MPITFPSQLQDILVSGNSGTFAPLRAFADRVGQIVDANALTFFPDYTDHGAEHINRVLCTAVDLIPGEVWAENKRVGAKPIFTEVDATVLVGATLLHDLAMHLQPEGFIELVRAGSRFRPVAWFDQSHHDHAADCPWTELWSEFEREARNFSERKLGEIIGESEARTWKYEKLPDAKGQWDLNERLVIGEFIRRHHARLAFEIALHGFPGVAAGDDEGLFPALGASGKGLKPLADLIGLAARSHGMSLRVAQAYLDYRYPGNPRPMGSAALYAMALLRVADYLQIDQSRAPAVLLQLKAPQSPISVQEWKKHCAVQYIGLAKDPRGKMIQVIDDPGELPLSLYLQLRDLIAGLQAEMDHATVVLDEVYGRVNHPNLHLLGLATRRVHSNLNDPGFRERLPYVSERTGFSTDPNLITLLVQPLYGNYPGVGVRELMQNATDAVRELKVWTKTHGPVDSPLLAEGADVLIDFVEQANGAWVLRVQDRGIGMTSETIQHFFLRAGASFRQSAEWARLNVGDDGKPQVTRSGRFGVGAFAIFLLGPKFTLWTRHAGDKNSAGFTLEASSDSHLIEIRRAESQLPVGTTIAVEISAAALTNLNLPKPKKTNKGHIRTDWFCWDWPKVVRRISSNGTVRTLPPKRSLPIGTTEAGPAWSTIYPKWVDAVHWDFGLRSLSCNGIEITRPDLAGTAATGWPDSSLLREPRIAISDSTSSLPVTIQRYALLGGKLPGVDDVVLDATLSYIAHALVCGPATKSEAMAQEKLHPLSFGGDYDNLGKHYFRRRYSALTWCATDEFVAPCESWIRSKTLSDRCIVWGAIDGSVRNMRTYVPGPLREFRSCDCAITRVELRMATSSPMRSLLGSLRTTGGPIFNNGILASALTISFADDHLESKKTDQTVDHEVDRSFSLTGEIGALQEWDIQRSTYGNISTSIQLDDVLLAAMRDCTKKPLYLAGGSSKQKVVPHLLYAAEFVLKKSPDEPVTLLARLWNKCLGPHAIPFDPERRRALIEHGRADKDLRRHIEAWERMKAIGSKWVNCSPYLPPLDD